MAAYTLTGIEGATTLGKTIAVLMAHLVIRLEDHHPGEASEFLNMVYNLKIENPDEKSREFCNFLETSIKQVAP